MNIPEHTEHSDHTEQHGTSEVKVVGRGKTILKRFAITLTVLTGIGALAALGPSLMETTPDTGHKQEKNQGHIDGEGWAHDLTSIDRVVTNGSIVAVKHGSSVSIYQAKDGQLLETLDVGLSDHRLVVSKSLMAVVGEEEAWVWTPENGTVAVDAEGFQIRALGQMIFAISDAQDEIMMITEQGELMPLDVPEERAVPLTGAVDGSIVWATGGNEIIVTDASGEEVSRALLNPATEDSTVGRWLGANVSHTFLVWGSDGAQTFAVHSNTDGSIISSTELEHTDEALWRVTSDQSLGTIESVVVQLHSGSITKFTEPFSDVVALSDAFIGVQGESTIRFDAYHVEEVTSGDEAATTVGETEDGRLIEVHSLESSEGVRLTVGG